MTKPTLAEAIESIDEFFSGCIHTQAAAWAVVKAAAEKRMTPDWYYDYLDGENSTDDAKELLDYGPCLVAGCSVVFGPIIGEQVYDEAEDEYRVVWHELPEGPGNPAFRFDKWKQARQAPSPDGGG